MSMSWCLFDPKNRKKGVLDLSVGIFRSHSSSIARVSGSNLAIWPELRVSYEVTNKQSMYEYQWQKMCTSAHLKI
jgi:hypothetical protein